MKKHIFTWHLNVSQLQFFACTRDDGRSENVRGMGLTFNGTFDRIVFLYKFARNIGGRGKLPTCPSGSSGPAGHLLTFFLQI